MSTCSSCNVERSTEPDYSPIQAITGQPFGWYSGDDGETISLHRESITAGRRIWPEGEDK